MIEARLALRSPLTVTYHSATLEEATTAIGKLVTVLGRESDRHSHRQGAASIRTDPPTNHPNQPDPPPQRKSAPTEDLAGHHSQGQ